VDKKELILQHRETSHFYASCLVSLGLRIASSWKFDHKCKFGQGSPVKFWM